MVQHVSRLMEDVPEEVVGVVVIEHFVEQGFHQLDRVGFSGMHVAGD